MAFLLFYIEQPKLIDSHRISEYFYHFPECFCQLQLRKINRSEKKIKITSDILFDYQNRDSDTYVLTYTYIDGVNR